ncbi:MAG: prolipoprotein diacylglyceryl transferase [Candidatus Adiutrix sp.]|nr:prolipoprotein diacylglyceryl transferase [Candidatus Adiutrix sp.]
MAPVWDLDPVIFQVPGLGLPVRYYGLIFGLVLVGGFFLFRRQILRGRGTDDEAFDFLLPGVLGVVLGARFGHVFFYNLDRLLADPAWLFRIWEGGLASHGAAAGLALALFHHSRRWKRPFWDVCDRFSFSAALGATLVRLGNFLNSEIVGRITDSRFGLRFPRYDHLPPELTPARFPSQLLEFGLGLAVLGTLFWLDARLGREKRPQGLLTAAFLIMYFTGRFLVEFVKERHGQVDSFILSRGQLLSLPGLVLGLALLWFVRQKPRAEY